MNKNFLSLLNSNWMFANNSETSLYPFLFQIINGTPVDASFSLPKTTHTMVTSNSADISLTENKGNVAVIKMHHPIFKYDQACGPQGTQSIMDMMDGWKNDASIAGVLFDKNSGGGQASGCSKFAAYLKAYPKPTGTYTNDTIGSAAYYGAAATDFIMADEHADFIGCIGSMAKRIDMEGILLKKGATINEFYSDLSPEKNLQARELKKGNEKPLIEKFLNPSAKRFRDDVLLYRPQVSELALKGDVFSPVEALNEGLIDQIGTLEDAINKIYSLAKAPNTNNSKNDTMSKLNVPLIEAAIGSTFSEGETEHGILLTDEQATTLNDTLATNEAAILAAETLATENATAIANAATEQTALTTAVQNALTAAEVENGAALSNVQGIEALSALVAEYGAKDGAKPTAVQANLDSEEKTTANNVGGIDITAAMNN